ncbi:MAG TPA: TIGR01777 family oxidoreductase [Phycisphaerae bacterium]|nr:TIGR01777 family oxidoreductase [Phycisphaerae bacterium]
MPGTEKLCCVAITGASGLIGRALSTRLRSGGHTVLPLQRNNSGSSWNVATGEVRTPSPISALIHLAGRNVAVRWTRRHRDEIWRSRVTATEKLAAFLAHLPPDQRPHTLISASAIGVYGDRGDDLLNEESAPAPEGRSFLADVCRAWEAATRPAQNAGIRVVHARLGVVLSRHGGALARLLTPTKFGLGGPIGSGRQFLSWISLHDTAEMLAAMLRDPTLRGPVNVVAGANRQHAFMRTLGHILHRPVVFPMPALAVTAFFGRMGQEVLLASQRVAAIRTPPTFAFTHPTLEAALRWAIAPPLERHRDSDPANSSPHSPGT